MGPITLAGDAKSSSVASSDACDRKMLNSLPRRRKPFASINMEEEKPFDFFRTFFEGVIAGGTAGVVVETTLYPIDTIKTRLQAARGGGKIDLKGLYSGLGGNLSGVLPASAVFIGVYEPAKQKLLKMFPENLSAAAHFTAGAIGGIAASLIRVPTEVVKQRMQTGQFTSAPDAVRLIASKQGFKGFYAAGFPHGDGQGHADIFRAVKHFLPGPYTFILTASKELPKQCIRYGTATSKYAARKNVGVRMPDDAICQAILKKMDAALISTSVKCPKENEWMIDPIVIADIYGPEGLDFVVDGGVRVADPSTVVDMLVIPPKIIRQGKMWKTVDV